MNSISFGPTEYFFFPGLLFWSFDKNKRKKLPAECQRQRGMTSNEIVEDTAVCHGSSSFSWTLRLQQEKGYIPILTWGQGLKMLLLQSEITALILFCLHPFFFFKTLDIIGNCQRPVFSLGDYLSSIGRRSCDTCLTKLCAFRYLTSKSNSEVSKSNLWKITSFLKTFYFRGSRFSQCFTLSTAPHDSLPRKVLC